MLNSLWTTVFVLSLSGTAAGAPFLLLKNSLLKRYNGKWYYCIWLFVLLTFVIPAGYLFEFSGNKPHLAAYGIQSANPAVWELPALFSDALEAVLNVIHSKEAGLIWLSGTLLFLAGNIWLYRIFAERIIRNSSPVINHEALDTLPEARRKLNIKSHIGLFASYEADSPMLIGLFRPKIILPSALLQDEHADLELIIAHELTHLANADILLKYFVMLVKCAHWFNPIIYAITKTIGEACDYACDYTVTKSRGHEFSLRYARMLLNTMGTSVLSRHKASCLATHLFQRKQNMKRRFELIMENNKKRSTGVTVFVLASVLAVSLYTTVMSSTALKKTGIEAQMFTATVEDSNTDDSLYVQAEGWEGEDALSHVVLDDGNGRFNFVSENGRFKFVSENVRASNSEGEDIPWHVVSDDGSGRYKLISENGEELWITLNKPENVNANEKTADSDAKVETITLTELRQ